MSLHGKVAVVTGAARGMGRAFALRLARAGADVAVLDINLDAAKEFGEELTAPTVPEEIRALGRRSIGIEGNLAVEEQAAAAVKSVVEEFGRIDILVNTAGGSMTGGPYRPISVTTATNEPAKDIDALIDLNLKTAVHMCQSVVPVMEENGGGSIVNIGSQSAVRVYDSGELTFYAAAKAALTHYTRYLAKEVGPRGIRVNTVHPGIIMTSQNLAKVTERGIGTDDQANSIPLGRLGVPDDCARVVEFFASDLSEYVSGQAIVVDGGFTLTTS